MKHMSLNHNHNQAKILVDGGNLDASVEREASPQKGSKN
jgi:hypothetical protein